MSQINMERVAQILKARGVQAHVGQSGGGTATLYAGPDYVDADGDARVVAMAGPGWFEGPGWNEGRGDTDFFSVGADDDGTTPPHEITDGTTDEQVADVLFARVAKHYANLIMPYIVDTVLSGQVPDTVRNFSDLHDHIDANDYLELAGVPLPQDDPGCEMIIATQEEVTRRLADGFAPCGCPVVEVAEFGHFTGCSTVGRGVRNA